MYKVVVLSSNNASTGIHNHKEDQVVTKVNMVITFEADEKIHKLKII